MKQTKLNQTSGQDVNPDMNETQAQQSELPLIFGMTARAAEKYWKARVELDRFLLLLEELSSLMATLREARDTELTLRAECLGQLAGFLEYQVICSLNQMNSEFASTRDVRDALEKRRLANFEEGGAQ